MVCRYIRTHSLTNLRRIVVHISLKQFIYLSGKDSIFTSTLHPTGEAGLEKIKELDDQYSSRYSAFVEAPAEEFQKPTFIIPLDAKFSVNEGEGLHLQAQVEPSADPKLVIEWFLNGKQLEQGSSSCLRLNSKINR